MSRVVFGASGLGPRFGGIGVVAAAMDHALSQRHHLRRWFHDPFARPWRRRATFVARGAVAAAWSPDAAIYSHVDLARAHSILEWRGAVPHAVFIHGWEVKPPMTHGRQRALERASLLLANSRTTMELVASVHPDLRQRIVVVHLGVDVPENEPTLSSRPPTALIVGRMNASERYKGHDEILDIWPQVTTAVPDARLLVVGEGDDAPRLRGRVASNKIRNVEFLGFVSESTRLQLMRDCRVFLFPSAHEGFGLAAVEAAAYGMAVVALKGTVLEELFPKDPATGEGTCALVEKMRLADLLQCCVHLLSDADAASALGRRGSALVRQQFLLRHFEERFLGAVEPLLLASG